MRRYLVIALFLFGSLWPSQASADLITYGFSGSVTSTVSYLSIYMPGIEVGTPLYGSITYDPNHWPQFDILTGDPSSMDLYVGDFHIYANTVEMRYLAEHSFLWHNSTLHVDGPLAHSWSFPDWLEIHFSEPDPTAGPGSLYFYGLDLSCTSLSGCTHGDTPGFGGSIDQVAQVPDAGSTAFLFALGMGALHAARILRSLGLRPAR